ncbi:unnamed protein product [Absidia cylindrospora]
MKPDWLSYIRPWHIKMVITACEIKPPSKNGSTGYSDFVKLWLEMRGMLNKVLHIIGVDRAAVFGILVDGYSVSTFKMDARVEVYRMIQLGNCKFIISQQSVLVLSSSVLFRCILRIKPCTAKMA